MFELIFFNESQYASPLRPDKVAQLDNKIQIPLFCIGNKRDEAFIGIVHDILLDTGTNSKPYPEMAGIYITLFIGAGSVHIFNNSEIGGMINN